MLMDLLRILTWIPNHQSQYKISSIETGEQRETITSHKLSWSNLISTCNQRRPFFPVVIQQKQQRRRLIKKQRGGSVNSRCSEIITVGRFVLHNVRKKPIWILHYLKNIYTCKKIWSILLVFLIKATARVQFRLL